VKREGVDWENFPVLFSASRVKVSLEAEKGCTIILKRKK
jgi:hypothetical protein